MNKREGVLGEARFTGFLIDGRRGHAHQVHFERCLSGDAHAVAFFARHRVNASDRHLVVFIVGHTEHGGHGDGEVPEITVGPNRCALVVSGGRVGKLVGGKFRGVHDVAFGVIGVRSNVPAG